MACNFSCFVKLKDFSKSRPVKYKCGDISETVQEIDIVSTDLLPVAICLSNIGNSNDLQ